jgi:hypothetical protein
VAKKKKKNRHKINLYQHLLHPIQGRLAKVKAANFHFPFRLYLFPYQILYPPFLFPYQDKEEEETTQAEMEKFPIVPLSKTFWMKLTLRGNRVALAKYHLIPSLIAQLESMQLTSVPKEYADTRVLTGARLGTALRDAEHQRMAKSLLADREMQKERCKLGHYLQDTQPLCMIQAKKQWGVEWLEVTGLLSSENEGEKYADTQVFDGAFYPRIVWSF